MDIHVPEKNLRPARRLCGPARGALFALGVLCTGIGIAGIVLPGLPGVLFLLIALFAFSRSSERMHVWLYDHPRFGKPLRDWHSHGVIPVRGKIGAVVAMAATASILVAMAENDWALRAVSLLVMAVVAVWIVTRPSRAPDPQ